MERPAFGRNIPSVNQRRRMKRSNGQSSEPLNCVKGTRRISYRRKSSMSHRSGKRAPQVAEKYGQDNWNRSAKGGFVCLQYARQFFRSPRPAATGGDLGWVRPAQCPQTLADAQADAGSQVSPSVSAQGVFFNPLSDIDVRVSADAIPACALSPQPLAISFPEGITEAQADLRSRAICDRYHRVSKAAAQPMKWGARLGRPAWSTMTSKTARTFPRPWQERSRICKSSSELSLWFRLEDGVAAYILWRRDDPQRRSAPSFFFGTPPRRPPPSPMSRWANERRQQRRNLSCAI